MNQCLFERFRLLFTDTLTTSTGTMARLLAKLSTVFRDPVSIFSISHAFGTICAGKKERQSGVMLGVLRNN